MVNCNTVEHAAGKHLYYLEFHFLYNQRSLVYDKEKRDINDYPFGCTVRTRSQTERPFNGSRR